MSKVSVGDRVRVVIEDVVCYVNKEDGSLSLHATVDIRVGEFGVVSIEVIEPPFVLPTKRWAQVVDNFGNLWTLTKSSGFSEWISLQGSMARSVLAMEGCAGLRIISEGVDDE